MGRQISLLLCAVQFLTRAPVPTLSGFEPDWITRSARYFPLVGQVVGAMSAAVLIGSGYLWPPLVAALLATAVGLLATGAFHEDGLADTVDGLGGGQTPERRLEIMKDSRIGTYGAAALLVALGLKITALSAMPLVTAALALIAAHGLARAAAVCAMRMLPNVSTPSAAKFKPAPDGVRTGELAFALLTALWPLAFLPVMASVAGLVLGAVLAGAFVLAARRLIGGYTGDVLGAVEQGFEIGFLLGACAVVQGV